MVDKLINRKDGAKIKDEFMIVLGSNDWFTIKAVLESFTGEINKADALKLKKIEEEIRVQMVLQQRRFNVLKSLNKK